MIEIQCPSCQTRYRIDENVLPQDSPTFKCSRCGHVFSGDPRLSTEPAAAAKPRPPRTPQPQDPAFAQAASPTQSQTRGGPSPGPAAAPRAEASVSQARSS